MQKRRVTITVDQEVADEVAAAVEAQPGGSVSAWVAEAMRERLERDRRLATLSALLDDHEAQHGVITDDELAEQAQQDRDAAATTRARARRAG